LRWMGAWHRTTTWSVTDDVCCVKPRTSAQPWEAGTLAVRPRGVNSGGWLPCTVHPDDSEAPGSREGEAAPLRHLGLRHLGGRVPSAPAGRCAPAEYDGLQNSSTVCSRIDALSGDGITIGTAWSFTKGDPPPPRRPCLSSTDAAAAARAGGGGVPGAPQGPDPRRHPHPRAPCPDPPRSVHGGHRGRLNVRWPLPGPALAGRPQVALPRPTADRRGEGVIFGSGIRRPPAQA
jgi:hypothetical protein